MASRWLDLSYPLSSRTPVFPGDAQPAIHPVNQTGKPPYAGSSLVMGAHTGTHIDAAAHFIPNGKTTADYPLERLSGLEGVLLDARDGKTINDSILDGVTVPAGGAVLFWTGYTDSHPVEFRVEDAPALTPSLARALVDARVSLVGIDSFSVDFEPFGVHEILLSADVLICETLFNLGPLAAHALKGRAFRFSAIPLNLVGTDASPCRAFAELD